MLVIASTSDVQSNIALSGDEKEVGELDEVEAELVGEEECEEAGRGLG